MIRECSRSLLLVVTMVLSGHLFSQQLPIAAGKSKFLGNIYSSSQISSFLSYWNQVTPENAGKWGSVEATRDNYNWTELDAAYNLAKDNGLPFKFHVLIWGNQQPAWIESLSTEDQLEEIHEWYDTVANRYPDIDFIEVVNEPLHDPPDGDGDGKYINALGGNGTTGWDWVITSFELAREYFPNAELMLNDYGIVGNTSAVNNYKQIIQLLKDRDLIDQIGVQCHAFTVNDLSAAAITNSLNSLAETELPIYVTELDIDGLNNDNLQLTRYQRVFPALWEHPAVKGITLWGWRTGMWRTAQGAMLMNSNNTERPALTWLRTYVTELDENDEDPVTGINNYTMEEFTIYPNPSTHGKIKVTGFGRIDKVKVVDVNGKVFKEQASFQSGAEEEIDVSSLIPGMYAVQVHRGKDVSVRRFIIK